MSSPEVEFQVGVSTAAEMLYIQSLFSDMGYQLGLELNMDASSGMAIAMRQGVGRIRHLETKSLWVQQIVHRKVMKIRKCHGKSNIADVGTKVLGDATLRRLCHELGMRDLVDGVLCDLVTDSTNHIIASANNDNNTTTAHNNLHTLLDEIINYAAMTQQQRNN